MSTILSVLEGEYDAKTKTMTFVGDGYDPDQKARFTQKMVTTTKDDGSRVFTLYMKFAGQPAEVKFMEITYTKRYGMPGQPGGVRAGVWRGRSLG